jgi:hypothetical protein
MVMNTNQQAKQRFVPMHWPPKCRRSYGVSEKFSEISEKSALRNHPCRPFITDVFFACEVRNRKFSHRNYRGTKFENIVAECPIIDSFPGDLK